jgi:hypothetical protein
MKNYVTFDADFPDDIQWTEAGDILVPAGQEVAEVISSALSQYGFACSSPEQHSYYGWAFEVNAGPQFLCIVQSFKTWLLICDLQFSLKDRLLGRKYSQEYQAVLDALNSVLQQDTRFSKVKWFTQEEYENSLKTGK